MNEDSCQFISENQAFINLMRVAKEDADMRDKLVGVLSLDPQNRKSLLNSMIGDLRLQMAPPELVAAIACFLNDDAADKALSILIDSSDSH